MVSSSDVTRRLSETTTLSVHSSRQHTTRQNNNVAAASENHGGGRGSPFLSSSTTPASQQLSMGSELPATQGTAGLGTIHIGSNMSDFHASSMEGSMQAVAGHNITLWHSFDSEPEMSGSSRPMQRHSQAKRQIQLDYSTQGSTQHSTQHISPTPPDMIASPYPYHAALSSSRSRPSSPQGDSELTLSQAKRIRINDTQNETQSQFSVSDVLGEQSTPRRSVVTVTPEFTGEQVGLCTLVSALERAAATLRPQESSRSMACRFALRATRAHQPTEDEYPTAASAFKMGAESLTHKPGVAEGLWSFLVEQSEQSVT